MLFDGIAPKARMADPELFKFQVRLYVHYMYARAADQIAEMTKAINKFGLTMQDAAKAFARMAKFLKEHPEWQNLNSKLKTGSNATN